MSTAVPTRTPAQTVTRAVTAVYVAFIGAGFGFASWASRIPQVRQHLHLDPGQLGLVLLSVAVGSLIAMPLSGLVIARIGESRTVVVSVCLLSIGLAVAGLGYTVGPAVVAIGLFLFGLGNGAWDVAMNVQAAAVEQALGRSIMSRFHAGYSIGTVAGAGVGAAMIALHVPVPAHLLGVAVVLVVMVPWAVHKGFLPHTPAPRTRESRSASRRNVRDAWRDPRTLLIGLFVLCMAFTEGTGNDWIGVAVIDGYHTADAVGTAALALFLAAMTTGRWFGPGLLDRHGRVPVLRICSALATVGLLLAVFGHALAFALVGIALWGLGTSLGFPTGMSAAADDPAHSASRVSVAASIAYFAFLGGPPLIGLIGDHVGVLDALSVAGGALAISILLCGACAPQRRAADAAQPVS